MNDISIFGTSSDSGKSTITFAIAKILQNLNIKVAPFKAQNVSNNSAVCDNGGEIGVAQYFQADVLGIKTTPYLNPVLLKIEGKGRSQIILNGKVKNTLTPREYYKNIDNLKPTVIKSFKKLKKKYDCIIAEGAGSPVELNLIDKDLSNRFTAKTFNTKIILVADIERGGVFASIYGTYKLLDKKLQKNVIGVIINKFRGDKTLFDDGIKIIENKFKIPVLGVIPYTPLNIGFEDSQSLINYSQTKKNPKINIAIITYPHLSNFNDIEPLILDDELNVEFVKNSIKNYDLIILAGSKSTILDLKWLKKNKLFKKLQNTTTPIYGICGGFEMMFKKLIDKNGVENDTLTAENGLNFIDDNIIFQKRKIVKRQNYKIFNQKISGFEIHNGISKKYPLFFNSQNINGSFIHGIFDNDKFRTKFFQKLNPKYKGYNFRKKRKKIINKFIKKFKQNINITTILKSIF